VLVVVGGHSRKIGKSSVVAGVIRALPEARWAAVKITQHGHRASGEGPYTLIEETAPSKADSGRYLAAGACRSFLLDVEAGSLNLAIPALREIITSSPNAIVESNSVLEFLPADLFLFVLDHAASEFKETSRQYAPRADAFVLVNEDTAAPDWRAEAAKWLARRPVFRVNPPEYVNAELANYVRRKLTSPETRLPG